MNVYKVKFIETDVNFKKYNYRDVISYGSYIGNHTIVFSFRGNPRKLKRRFNSLR